MGKLLLIVLVLVVGACSAKKPGVDPRFVVYPYDFYEKFNLRSIISSFQIQLQHDCRSYPKDFFKEQDLRVANDTLLVLDNGERRLTFEMVSYNQVIITDVIQVDGYKAKFLHNFYYNKEADDFRVDEIFIEKNKDCRMKDDKTIK